jgi:environmental stress-induced protein Ves
MSPWLHRASPTSCSPYGGPVRDLDDMTRHDRLSATGAVSDRPETGPTAVAGSHVVVLVTGSAVAAGADGSRAELHPLDAACIGGGHVMLVSGSARAALVRVRNHRQTQAGRSPSQHGEPA